ncbi:MAG TPA: TIGR00725 family protein [Planctomycetota bacterium]|jgi:hypothetical protein|nr:TIGR00725 family protein [Planctomycetota bacterium]OQC19731.1 MAG: putative lysine decarboxylase [Planctomycetes bacterium ADurb.Bin069]HNR99994.1 TIGR00725 family protein [Planctomycetota bacterium]HNU25702.1 TIGR00725 family protein [Planctomycetota bacterium]HOE31066.1 TIGR00725 family protein [Planctomycetota bacterium]
MKRAVAVIGASQAGAAELELARRVGTLLAREGLAVVCGGLGGVMAAACEGAKAAGGITVGILPGREKLAANPYVDIALPTGLGEARNALVALAGDAVIAIGGGFGTLSEIALALRAGKTVAALAGWELAETHMEGAPYLRAATPEEAVAAAVAAVARG